MLGEQLRKARERAGLSQEELALKARADRSYISEIERDHKSPPRLAAPTSTPSKSSLSARVWAAVSGAYVVAFSSRDAKQERAAFHWLTGKIISDS